MPDKTVPRPRKRRRDASAMTVRFVPPEKPYTPEEIAEAKEALFKLVRALARAAAREDFEKEQEALRQAALSAREL